MQERQRLAVRVLLEGVSVAQAAREAGVSRVTAHEWLGRARREGIGGMQEYSRRPHTVPCVTPELEQAREQALELKARRPAWGAKKLHAFLWPPDRSTLSESEGPNAPVCVRTVDRWLKEAGLVRARGQVVVPQRFEREGCNSTVATRLQRLGSALGLSPFEPAG